MTSSGYATCHLKTCVYLCPLVIPILVEVERYKVLHFKAPVNAQMEL